MDDRNTVIPRKFVCCAALYLVIKAMVPLPVFWIAIPYDAGEIIVGVAAVFVTTVGDMLGARVEDRGFIDRCVGAGDTFGRIKMWVEGWE